MEEIKGKLNNLKDLEKNVKKKIREMSENNDYLGMLKEKAN